MKTITTYKRGSSEKLAGGIAVHIIINKADRTAIINYVEQVG